LNEETGEDRSFRLWAGVAGVGEGAQEGDEGGLVGLAKRDSAAGVFGKIGVELGGALHPGSVVCDDFFQGVETAVVHVGGGEGDVAQGGGLELARVGLGSGDKLASLVGGHEIESVVFGREVGEEAAAVAVKTIGPELFTAGVKLAVKEFQAACFLGGEFDGAAEGLIEARIGGDFGEKELLKGEADAFDGNRFVAKRGGEIGLE